ncbi:MAG: hypothetical protein JSR82_23510 [Verrucomicrobia bacterium]|nr:hypothetical protein [Verrucomicrobiota bacterium]
MASRRFHSLRTLLGGYLHEDWADEFDRWEEALAHYLRQEPAAEVERCRVELRELVVTRRTDAELGAFCQDLGCAYLPDGGWRKWLKAVLTQLERAAR